jgi:anti-sigma B factor antagonist
VGKVGKKILLNLANISFFDSPGVGELMSAFTSVRNQGGELKLLHLTKTVHDLGKSPSSTPCVDVRDNEAEAIAAFNH